MNQVVSYVKQPIWIDTLDPFFCHWFTGFTDGEGSFQVSKCGKGYGCKFQLHLREDDKCIIYMIQKELGIGKCYSRKRRGSIHPTFSFEVSSKEGCTKLCELFSYYQPRTKKANDFFIWREAVYKWIAHKNGESWNEMRELYEEIKKVRQYIEIESCEV